ncbi:MAG: hypothetical protein JSS66_01215 [Armatimonadetes bacterium]|nr:hypothetical protein [Armatimonadota bacterium]
MMIEQWVQQAVGIYAVLGSAFFLVLIVAAGYLLVLLRDIATQVKNLTGKVEALTDKVTTVAEQVKSVTAEVGARTTGIVRMVDDSAQGAIRVLEMLAPVFVVYGAFVKVRSFARRRKR